MNTAEIIKKALQRKEVQDYTYLIFFLFLSSFFILFVIRPVLSIAVALQKEAKELQQLNAVYEKNILKIVQLQDQLQEIRPLEYLYEVAFPQDPKLQEVIGEMRALAKKDSILLESFETADVSYIKNQASAKQMKLTLRTRGSYENTKSFIQGILNQKRLKVIEGVHISSSTKNSKVATQELNMDIELVASYY